ncbi:glycoside hydrolase family 1 protein [Candidatus Daviesbacteria bacterium]|nr:glycoside hydrolase family 1 protein [Candidatus Daviesbacteria bacterium]
MVNLPPAKHNHHILNFPEDFLWGAATSAHQVEGNNVNNQWWNWEQNLPEQYRSGETADQYHRFKEDFDLAKEFGHNAHRLSIEWSRIEPFEGKFDQFEIDHYREVFKALRQRGMKIMLTLHHFTDPLWITKIGGWQNGKTPFYFNRFVSRVVKEYKEYIDLWITINEPGIYTWGGYLDGRFPPGQKSIWKALLVTLNLAAAHRKAYKTIHKIIPSAKVGMAQNVVSFGAQQSHSILQHVLVWLHDIAYNHFFYILTPHAHDFLGLNYYFHERIGVLHGRKLPQLLDASLTKKDVSDMGWELYPEGIFDALRDLAGFKLPIYITENGLASTNDDRRCRFLISYLKEIYHAIESGVDVKGYFHWSLTDNFEWADGFKPRFGLIGIDYNTKQRIPRLSAQVYKSVIKHNGIPHHLMRFIGHTVNAKEVLEKMKT